MITGPLPTVSCYGTWSENIEVWDIESDELMTGLEDLDEITLTVIDRTTKNSVTTLSMTNGDIVIPSVGIIQWRMERAAVGTVMPGTYDVVMVLTGEGDEVVIIQGSISFVD